MTTDEIIELARQAGLELDDSLVLEPEVIWYVSQPQIELFAKLVAEKEREWVIDLLNTKYRHTPPQIVSDIRARGQA